MGCLKFDVTPTQQAVLSVTPVAEATLVVAAVKAPVLELKPVQDALLMLKPVVAPVLSLQPVPQPQLTVGEVCTVSGGTIVVLAASDGPLRTKNGGYILLNPETNPEEYSWLITV